MSADTLRITGALLICQLLYGQRATAADAFDDIPRVDVHAHCGTPERMAEYVQISRELKQRHGQQLVAWIDLDFLRQGSDVTADRYLQAAKEQYACRFLPCLHDDMKDGLQYTADDIESWQKRGVVGLKIWLGLSEAIDNRQYDPLFAKMAALKFPGASVHIAQPYPTSWCRDPVEFWRAQNAWERVLDRHPELIVVNAHMLDHFNSDEQLDYLVYVLATYPKVHVDLAARFQQFHMMDRDKLRDFVIRFQDRILFGTDISHLMGSPQEMAERYYRCFRLLETDEIVKGSFFEDQKERRGLALPRDVLEKIYYRNALRIYPRLQYCSSGNFLGNLTDRSMNRTTIQQLCVSTIVLTGISALAADETPPILKLTGDWQVQVTVPASGSAAKELTATLNVSPPTLVAVRGEKYDRLPLFNPDTAGWVKGVPLIGLRTQETTSRGLLDPSSLQVRAGLQPDAQLWELGKDYAADLDWATIGRLPDARIADDLPVYVDYRHALLRIDSIVLTREGRIELREGTPHAATPQPPSLAAGERRLANVFLPGRIAKLEPLHLLPIRETAYPEPPKPSPSVAELKLPKTMKILREGGSLRILAWGDSVTDGGYLPRAEHNRWQAQFAARLRERFPQAKIELVSQGWGGRNTASFLAEPSGSPHNYQEQVLGAMPDLIVSEFVNDAGLSPEQVEERYGKFLADFTAIGAEWIILTPHYVRPDWMGLIGQRDIDADPRPYVAGLRQFAARHPVALADASLRWGRLWRQGIPYSTLLSNAINHPTPDGMKLFADSLMALFP